MVRNTEQNIDDELALHAPLPKICVPKFVRIFLWLLILLGVAIFVRQIFGPDPRQGWLSFHVNFVYWYFLAGAVSC